MKANMSALLEGLKKADGGICISVNEFKEAQYGLPLKHYCLQYLFGSTGLRYGGFYMCAGKPKSCKSPFVFDLAHRCCELDGISYIYELEGKMSPTLISSMLADHPEWMDGGPFQILKGHTLDEAETHLTKKILPTFKKLGAYDTPLLIDWDSISGAAMTDVVDKIQTDGTVGKGYHEKPHVMKYLTESWSVLVGNLPVVFVGVLQEKTKASEGFGKKAPEKSYGGGDSQLFKVGTLLTFQLIGKLDSGKRIKISTELNGFADARQIEATFTWNQFGSLEDESQGHKWNWADATALCLAQPKIVGELRDIIDVKRSDKGLVTCKQFGLTSVTAEEFEAALFAEENKKVLNDLYSYHKVEKIKTPSEYIEYVRKLENRAQSAKEADKAAKQEAKEAQLAAEKAKQEAKQAKKEAKVKKTLNKDPLASLKALADKAQSDSAEVPNGE